MVRRQQSYMFERFLCGCNGGAAALRVMDFIIRINLVLDSTDVRLVYEVKVIVSFLLVNLY